MDHVKNSSTKTRIALDECSALDALDMWKDCDWARFHLVRSELLENSASEMFDRGTAQVFAQFIEQCVKPNVEGARRYQCEFRAFLKRPTRKELKAVEAAVLRIYLADALL